MGSDQKQSEDAKWPILQQLGAPMTIVDCESQTEALRREESGTSGRMAKTIVKYSNFTMVLMVMRSKATFPKHKSAGRISVQVLSGHIQMRVLDKLVDLPAGRLIALDRNIAHDVEALDESSFILTICME